MQSRGVQKQAEQHISGNSIQVIFLLRLFTVLQCSAMPINEIDSRSPGTKVPQQLSRTACQFSWGLPGVGSEPGGTSLVCAYIDILQTLGASGCAKAGACTVMEWESLRKSWRKRMAGSCLHRCAIISSLLSSCP